MAAYEPIRLNGKIVKLSEGKKRKLSNKEKRRLLKAEMESEMDRFVRSRSTRTGGSWKDDPTQFTEVAEPAERFPYLETNCSVTRDDIMEAFELMLADWSVQYNDPSLRRGFLRHLNAVISGKVGEGILNNLGRKNDGRRSKTIEARR